MTEYRYVTHPARCNRRECQARRNLPKHPALYVRWPKCHVCSKGLMYVDWYRMNKGAKDNAPICKDPYCTYDHQRLEAGKKVLPLHRVSTRGCSGYDDYMLSVTMSDTKHSPIKPAGGSEIPF